MSTFVQAVSDDSFESEVIESSTPVMVDFWAEWCGPCKMLAPVVDEVAKAYDGKLKIVKLDVEANPSTPAKFGVRGIPTLIIFKEGQVQATQVGFVNKPDLMKFIDANI